jgi:hypothetical protein
MFRRLTLRVVVTAMTTAALVVPAASAMPTRDVDSHAGQTRNPRLVEAVAHAATMRAIGARLTARVCE